MGRVNTQTPSPCQVTITRQFGRFSGGLKHGDGVMAFFDEMFGSEALQDLLPGDLEKCKAKRKADGVSDTTINIDVRTIKAALQAAVEWGKLPANPFERAKSIRTSQKTKSHVSDAKLAQLLGGSREWRVICGP